MQSNSNTTVVSSATYAQIDTVPVSPTTCKIIKQEIIRSKVDNSETQVFELEFLGEYSTAGTQKSYRRLGTFTNSKDEPFTVVALKTLDNCEVQVFRRDTDKQKFFNVKGLGKDFAKEVKEAADRATALWG